MSPHFETSPKHCAKQYQSSHKLKRRLFYSISALVLSVAVLVLLVYFILHPTKPKFYLKEANLYQLSLASPAGRFLNSTFQFTLVSTNTNMRVGIYYDELHAYASYHGQRITTVVDIPPFYQGHQDTNLLSATLYGNTVPVAAPFGYKVVRDQTAGKLMIKLKVDGKLRWKVGTWVSSTYHIDVDCTAIMGFGTGGAVNSMHGTQCSTSV